MPVFLLVPALLFLGLLGVFLITDSDSSLRKIGKTFLCIFLPLFIWFIGACSRDTKWVETRKSVKIDNIYVHKELAYQVVKENGSDVFNLTSRFGHIIRDDTVVRVNKKDNGWYCGIYFGSREREIYEEEK